MKTVTILFLICSISISAQNVNFTDNEMNTIWGQPLGTPFDPSYYAHFNYANKVYLILELGLQVQVFDHLTEAGKIIRGVGAITFLIFAKEGYDLLDKRHVASWKDIGFGMLGVTSGVVLHIIIIYAAKGVWLLLGKDIQIKSHPKYRNHPDNLQKEIDWEKYNLNPNYQMNYF